MEYRILGPLEVCEGDRSLPLGGAKERAVLAVLLLHPDEVVSVDRLIDDLWGEGPPAGAVNTVQTYVSRLRKVLHADGRSALLTRSPGYVLRVEPTELDAHRFARLAEQGRESLAGGAFEIAAQELRGALELWRGPPLADFTFEPFAQSEIIRLQEARLAVIEDRVEVDLELGRHRDIVGELKSLVGEHPLRERLQAQLMLALYRCGRQVEALDGYAEARRLLVEELGTEPGPMLESLHRQVLRHDPALKPSLATHNLPVSATSFVGRGWEVGEVKKLLRETRLLTVTGVGGSGKTRLAVEVGREVLDDYDDGVWLVELGALADDALVPQAIATVLGIREQSSVGSIELLETALQRRDMLLLLDNCEHLIDGCARLIGILLSSCPGVRVLVTSREALRVSGETVWQLPPLAYPDEEALAPDALGAYESVQLFAERATAVMPEFRIAPKDAPAIAQICRQLDGIPLAIELAAARSNLLSPRDIAEHLDDRFRLLSRGSRTAPARQQTLRAMVDWSYDLLTPEEGLLFARLSVFAGGLTLDAAEAICSGAGIERADVLDVLGRLVDKSLVTRQEGIEGSVRYRLLETLRRYAANKLTLEADAGATNMRHADYFLALAERAEPELRGSAQAIWLARLEADQDNLRTALAWSLDRGETEIALRLASALARDREMRGNVLEALGWLENALAAGGEAPDELRAKALSATGILAEAVGRLDQAESFAHEALELYRALGDRLGEARATLILGSVAQYKGDYGRAAGLLEEGLITSRELDETWNTAWALHRLGMVARLRGEYDRAVALHEESGQLFQNTGDKWRVAYSLWMRGVVERYRGTYDRAVAFCSQSLRLFEETGDRSGVAHVRTTLADVARLQQSFDRAVSLYEVGLAELERLGDRRCVASSLANLGAIAHRRSDHPRARKLYGESLSVRNELGDKVGIAECLEGLALIQGAEGRVAEAGRLFGAAEALREETGAVLAAAERAVRERDLSALRDELGEDRFSAAWTQGRALTPEEAIELAGASHRAEPRVPRAAP